MTTPVWQRMLAPLALPYALALGVKNAAYARGLLPQRTLGFPVVSVGNLSAGGAGKTPVVIALASLLLKGGISVDVLSRGYGRRSSHAVEPVDPHGSARRFGDEPLLIARQTGVPVFVGADRLLAGRLAERAAAQPVVHLLDDGFQHRRLARAVDVVVIHPGDSADRLLPTGWLREPFSALRRAHIMIVREGDAETEEMLVRAGLRKPVWRVRRSIAPPRVAGEAVAFCGIAHPEEFFRSLRAADIALRAAVAFRDHHRFRESDLRMLREQAVGAAALLTTEKDWQRLDVRAREQLSAAAPLLAVPLRAEFVDEQRCLDELLSALAPAFPMRK